MKIGIFSDLHLDHGGYFFDPDPTVDLYINAGDTATGRLLFDWWLKLIDDKEFGWKEFRILGNHDFWDIPEGKEIAHPDWYCEFKEHNGLTIAGAPLWTDLSEGLDWANYVNGLVDMRFMGPKGWDFDTYMKHHRYQKEFLLCSSADIIVSHHAPSYRSVSDRFKGDPCNASFCTELGYDILDMAKPPLLWIHGHMHDPVDYMIGKTRVISNPRGYPGESNHKDYQPLIVEI